MPASMTADPNRQQYVSEHGTFNMPSSATCLDAYKLLQFCAVAKLAAISQAIVRKSLFALFNCSDRLVWQKSVRFRRLCASSSEPKLPGLENFYEEDLSDVRR
jgi:hypothetical protein